MTSIDIPTLVNWIVLGLVGFVFGVSSTWLANRYQRKRDETAWLREKENLQEQFMHDKEMLEAQFKQRANELEQQLAQTQSSQLRENLTVGLDNPDEAIKNIEYSRRLRSKLFTAHPPE